MEENVKQVRIQDRQDQTILEKRQNAKVPIFAVVFFFNFLIISVHFKLVCYYGRSRNEVI